MSDGGFWVTLDLLVERKWRKAGQEYRDVDLKDWLDTIAARSQSSASNNSNKSVDSTTTNIVKSNITKKKKTKNKLDINVNDEKEPTAMDVSFSLVRVRARLDRLMGSNLVRLTDRKYMQKLQQRIREEHVEKLEKRIKEREIKERDREKKLLLSGHIPMSACPPELANHPVFVINRMTTDIINARRAKMQTPVAKALKYLKNLADAMGLDLQAEEAKSRRELAEAQGTLILDDLDEEDELEEEEGYEEEEDDSLLFPPEEFERLYYEDPMIKELRTLETVDELYHLADRIVGDCEELFHKK